MTTRWMRAVWIAAAGSCIALGVGSGVANATTESTDSAGPSDNQSSQSSESSPAERASATEGVDGQRDSGERPDRAADSDKPATSLTASTVTVRRDDEHETAAERSGTNPATRAELSAAQTSEPVSSTTSGRPPQPATPSADADEKFESSERQVVPTTAVEQKAPVEQPVATRETSATEPVGTDDATLTAGTTETDFADPETNTATSASLTARQDTATPQTIVRSAPAQPGGPLLSLVFNVLSTFGLLPAGPAAPAVIAPSSGTSPIPGVVTGVVVGRAPVDIPVGSSTYTGAADWYFPTQADGTVQAQGVTWLQHGFLGDKSWYSALAQRLAQETNNVVVVANVPSFPFFTCSGCTLSGVPMQRGVAALFVDPDRAALNTSAIAAGYRGTLPTRFVLTGHSAGGGLAAAAGGFYVDAVSAAANDLLGVVMYDGVSSNGTFADAIASLNDRNIPVYQIAAPPQPWNANGQTTADLIALRPGQFVGDVLANGSHVDSLIGGSPLVDLISQILIRPSPPGNTEAVYTLAGGWINDMYAGRGPGDPLYGTYGAPNDYVVLGPASAVVLGLPPVVDVDRYLGARYEVGSVKQFSSTGLVNTKAVCISTPTAPSASRTPATTSSRTVRSPGSSVRQCR